MDITPVVFLLDVTYWQVSQEMKATAFLES